MQSFKQYIVEGRDAPLYHATTVVGFYGMVQDGGITPDTKHGTKELGLNVRQPKHGRPLYPTTNGVSLTRDLHFAMHWKPSEAVILQLDQAALASRYKIIPQQYWNGVYNGARGWRSQHDKPNEAEEFLVATDNISLKYIRKIYISRSASQHLVEMKIHSAPGSEIHDGIDACVNLMRTVGYEVF